MTAQQDELIVPEHPAKFSKAILDRLGKMLAVERDRVGHVKVLDPFAGAGGIHALAEDAVETYGVELQPEWAAAHPNTIAGSVLELPLIFPPATFDLIVTSPCYGNRMADSHNAQERCSTCEGQGCEQGCGNCRHANDGPESHRVCRSCGGAGRRDHHRNTYTHKLRESGVEPHPSTDNAVRMAWGPRYREFHEKAWRACHQVLRPGGLVLLNVKNHVRTVRKVQEVQRVAEFHLNAWLLMNYTIEECRRIPTRGLADGANHDVRTPAELVIALRRPL